MNTRIFVSYAKEDQSVADRLYEDLLNAGEKPWLDRHDLLPGQLWETAIGKAIRQSSYFIALQSAKSVGKKGFVQKEIRQALEVADEFPEDTIFVIPVRIDDCEPSFERLSELHRVDLFPNYAEALAKLLRVFNYPSEKAQLTFVESSSGTVRTLTERGWGFLAIESSPKAIFFHHGELRGVMFEELRPGDKVTFDLWRGPKGMVAVDVLRAPRGALQ